MERSSSPSLAKVEEAEPLLGDINRGFSSSSRTHVPAVAVAHSIPVNDFEKGGGSVTATRIGIPAAYAIAIPELPSALQLLETSTGFFVREKVAWFEEIVGWEQANRYRIYWRPENYPPGANPNENELRGLESHHVFDAKEDSDVCSRQCCGPWRPFRVDVYDSRTKQVAFYFERPFQCTLPCEFFCFGCILNPQRMYVRDVNGNAFSTIMQTRRNCSCSRWLDIYDGEVDDAATGSRAHAYSLEMFWCQCCGPSCCQKTVEMAIRTGDGVSGSSDFVGRLANVWPGWNLKAFCSKADNYVMEFPRHVLVGHKMALLGACILVDFMFFENRANKDRNRNSGYGYGAPSQRAMFR